MMARLIADKYAEWAAEAEARFNQLKANEEELNRIFIDIYGTWFPNRPAIAILAARAVFPVFHNADAIAIADYF